VGGREKLTRQGTFVDVLRITDMCLHEIFPVVGTGSDQQKALPCWQF